MASKAGDNYCSFIYRVQMSFAESEEGPAKLRPPLSVVIKSTPISTAIDFLDDMKVYLKEKVFYYTVLPVIENCAARKSRFGAKILHSMKKPVNTLVFEDLNVLGYTLASRELGLDERHAKLVLQRLAHFHSASVAVMEKDPELLLCFNSGILAKGAIQRDNSTFYGLIKSSCQALIDIAKTWNGYEQIAKKLELYIANLRENLLKMQEPIPGEFEVLNHGDLWVNNFMFKYNSNCELMDLVFVDYQMSILGSPAMDLNYFFYTSLPVHLLKSKREDFIKFYYAELNENLKQLKYRKIPSYEELRAQVALRESFGFFANHAIYPIISIDQTIAADSTFENFADRDFAKKKFTQILSQQKLMDMYKYTLKHFDEMKIFD
uniref:CHK kinase-like domain-containing protein n=1 Tax=Stomoxys calcitrans TaxID=35570 RepID=A0A1I8PNA5_STOCA